MANENVFINWNTKYLIGDKHIDSEHEMLFEIAKKANSVYSLATENLQKQLLKNVLDELHSYVNFHFKNEEEYMEKIKYPSILEHKKNHKKMLEILTFLTLNLEIYTVSQTGQSLYDFVQNIFVKHMISEDTKIIKFKKQLS